MVGGAQGAKLVEAGLPSLSESRRKLGAWGLPWQSSGWDSTVPQQGAQVPSLVWGTEILHAMEWPKKKKSPSWKLACQLTSPALLYGKGPPVPIAELVTAVHESSTHQGITG